jgi:predicted NBD/HSP70 family sugar kinase
MTTTKRYTVIRSDGKAVQVSVPTDPDPQDLLVGAIRDCLSPHAVAAIAVGLDHVRATNPAVDQEIGWFRGLLVDVLGGPERLERLAEEL